MHVLILEGPRKSDVNITSLQQPSRNLVHHWFVLFCKYGTYSTSAAAFEDLGSSINIDSSPIILQTRLIILAGILIIPSQCPLSKGFREAMTKARLTETAS